jgi:hypothetical protein
VPSLARRRAPAKAVEVRPAFHAKLEHAAAPGAWLGSSMGRDKCPIARVRLTAEPPLLELELAALAAALGRGLYSAHELTTRLEQLTHAQEAGVWRP